jgi:aryl-alcohol dehydrogenase-like predicted oxidoreductase
LKVVARRVLGAERLDVSAIGLGCFPFSGSYGAVGEKDAIRIVRTAIDVGMNFLDTADIYGPFTSELAVGKAVAGQRDAVRIASKFGAVPPTGVPFRGDAAYVHSACDASLARLGVDYLDLYYLHRVDPQVPIEETVGAMGELVSLGKIRHLGLCEVGPETLRRAVAVHPITALQSEWSLWAREIEVDVVPEARRLGVGLVPFSPLGRGFLTGRLRSPDELGADDFRRALPRFEEANFLPNLEFVDRIAELATTKGCSPAQLSLAWLLSKGSDVVPIPGSDRLEYVRENAAAADLVLSSEEIERLEQIAPVVGAVRGSRARPGQAIYERSASAQ